MNEFLNEVIEQRLQRTAKALQQNNMDAYLVETKEQVAPLVQSLLPKGSTVAVGGSASLDECGILPLLRSGDYTFLDRYAPGITAEQVEGVFRQSFFADTYLCSSNAVTENGELYNVDGNSNRVAAMAFGPKSVILVVGYNKVVRDLVEAERRVQEIAAPANAKRLGCKTPCAATGVCADCKSNARICCTAVIHRRQRAKGRIKVILVGEALGF